MGGILGGGGGGTQTVVQNSTPWNASELGQVQDQAINLLNNNPINYFPGQTYAPPPDLAFNSLGNSAGTAFNAGNNTAGYVAPFQAEALTNNQYFANGGAYQSAQPWNNYLSNFGTSNPGQQGINALDPVATGQYLNAGSGFYSPLQGLGANNPGYSSGAISELSPVASGVLYNSMVGGPAGGSLSSLAQGGYLQGAQPILGNLEGVSQFGPGSGQLGATANGAYLGANPYLTGMFNAATQPLINQYMTATAPQTDSGFEQYGRFSGQGTGRSGADTAMQSVNQQNLGNTLQNFASNLYGNAYQQERGLMTNAANSLLQGNISGLSNAGNLYSTQTGQIGSAGAALGGLQNQGANVLANAAGEQGNLATQGQNSQIGALSAGGQLYNQGVQNLSDAARYQGLLGITGNQAQQSALDSSIRNLYGGLGMQQAAIGAIPGLTQMPFNDYQTALASASGIQGLNQAQIDDAMARFYGNEMVPWQTLGQAAGIVGSGIPGASSITSPIGASGISSLLGGLTAAKSLGGMFGGSGGLGGLGGLSAVSGGMAGFPAFASLGTAAGTGLGSGIATDLATGITSDVAPSAFATAAPLAFGSVVCTELMRQEKMPRRWWMINSKHDRYIPQWIKDGYYVWAIPAVEHMRKSPDSFYSKLLSKAFLARSENIAHVMGVRDARRRWYGSLITGAIGVVSIACAAVTKPRDWWSLYSNDELKKLVRVR